MSNRNLRNVTFLAILIVLLSATFTYITISKYYDWSLYASLFHKED